MLKVQEYLTSGGTLKSLLVEYAIKVRVNEHLGVVSLNYDQLNSPLNEEIVQECRALILNLDDWSVLSWPFKKFFNLGQVEVPQSFDWDNFTAFDKLDGSLISIWHHHQYGWQVATRSVPDAITMVNDTDMTFAYLVFVTLDDMGTSWEEVVKFLTPGFSYAFELTGPENQIVVEYKERSLTLTGIRNLETMTEILPSEWVDDHSGFPLPFADEYHGWTMASAGSAIIDLNPREREGYVLVDRFWNRIKIKSEAYCFMSNKRDALSKSAKARLELILSEKMDDVLPILPQFVQKQLEEMKKKLSMLSSSITTTFLTIRHIEDQKEFASEALKYPYSAFLFSLRKGKTDLLPLFCATSPVNLLHLLNYADGE